MSGLLLEYSPSNRAACKGARPCMGTKIGKGELRLGEEVENHYSDGGMTYKYRHWGCVTPALLNKMKRAGGARNVTGFARLSAEDQNKVTAAVQRGSVDPADVPPSARPFDHAALQALSATASSSQATTATQATNKRKRDEVPSSSQAPARPKAINAAPSTREIVELSDSGEESGPGAVAKKRKVDVGTVVSAAKALESRINSTFASAQAGPSTSGSSASAINAASTPALNNGEIVELDSDNEEDASADEVYATMPTNVVGIQYYAGLVGYGEQVDLVREPTNSYDRYAIRVLNISGHQVGHLPKTVAGKLSPLLDRGLVSVEGTMTSGNVGAAASALWKLTIDVSIIGPSDPTKRSALEPLLTWATPGQRGFDAMKAKTEKATTSQKGKKAAKETHNATKLREIMDNMAHLDDGSRRETLMNSLCGQDILELPLHPSPPSRESGLLHTNLLKHQSQALKWCIDTENPQLPAKVEDKPVQFWEMKSDNGKNYYYNFATKTPQQERPVLGRGGIIGMSGDDMGLGKTLTVLSLILATRKEKTAPEYSGATLIVAPLSVLSNWSTQLEEHVTEDAGIRAHVYYGEGRNVSASFLKKQDVVVTTYNMITADLPPTKTIKNPDGTESIQVKATKSGLFAVKWKRCVLDEGHTIRNPKTKTTQACYTLDAERRWIVTGTPIINNPSDLGSLLRFLRICNPLDHPEYFKRLLSRPLSQRDPKAVELLKALMASCCLRRTKEMQDKDGKSLVPLPPVLFNIVKVELDAKTREFYNAVEEESRALVQELVIRNGQADQVPLGVNVLSMLTRLRQIALDRHLVPASYLEELRALAKVHQNAKGAHGHQPINISDEEKARLHEKLDKAIKDNEECAICIDVMTDPRITICAHVFCLTCITEVISRQNSCPMDRQPLRQEHLIEPKPPQEDEDDENDDEIYQQAEPPSQKVVELIKLLNLQPSDSKSLVFSQFTSYLDKIGAALRDAKIPFVRFDGSMSAKKRKAVLEAFNEPLTNDDDEDEDETEPESGDEGYEEYWRKKKGKGKAQATKAVTRLLDRGKTPVPVVMLISLKSGALGLNCTIANNVFLMDPWWQEAIESQAIDRINRLGQKKDVFVYQMVAQDTIEEKVLQIQERKKQLIKQAFSGTKTKQTQREKKEARLQELVELFAQK